VFTLGLTVSLPAQEVSSLRLVPFPKELQAESGTFALDRPLVLEAKRDVAALLGGMIVDELTVAKLPAPKTRPLDGADHVLRLSPAPGGKTPAPTFRTDATAEDYVLHIRPDSVAIAGRGPAGLLYGVQTLRQLIRANRRGSALPCLTVRDWPSIRWRAFQDDLTRGPSSTLDTLKREVALGALLKMNLFTYYMEYQYAFSKHPLLGPKDGSFTPEELRALVAFGAPLHVDILGNQQSFGHFAHMLKHKKYQHLRETPSLLCPVKEESYQLLDDMYSEVVPLLPLPFFNVCCDETWGLGTGPSKALAEKIGVGGVYVRHIRRVHDLLKDKYGKRMMMWGDIILQHPEHLKEIPTDTIMMTWGYDGRPNREKDIIPFAKSGYEFFVCPGVSNWRRILPDFDVATANIRTFVRDGAKHGALGVLNTAWDDDGENFNPPSWHGYAWGAECAWNASATTPEDFNRRVGAVLFGEPGEEFGRAIGRLAKVFKVPGAGGMNNRRFWQLDLDPIEVDAIDTAHQQARQVLELTGPAIEHLLACQSQATVNADVIDYFLFGARRMELIGRRLADHLGAAGLYAEARKGAAQEAKPLLQVAEALLRGNRDAHEALGKQFTELWMRENKPYALDWTMKRYQQAIGKYDSVLDRLAAAAKNAQAGKPLPPPEKVGLAVKQGGKKAKKKK